MGPTAETYVLFAASVGTEEPLPFGETIRRRQRHQCTSGAELLCAREVVEARRQVRVSAHYSLPLTAAGPRAPQ